jgi:citrate synthase
MKLMKKLDYSEITPEICELTELCKKNMHIDSTLYTKYDVKRGLRDINGKGVLAGLTDISDIRSSIEENGVSKR